jgi:hypothetical protein
MSRITRTKRARKGEAYEQRLRELEVAMLEHELHQEWQHNQYSSATHHASATTNGRATVRVTVHVSVS